MRLHEFLGQNEDGVVERCVERCRAQVSGLGETELHAHFHGLVREVRGLLREHDGLPAGADAVRLEPRAEGREIQRRRLPIESLVPTYTVLSVTVGELGARDDLAFTADEYRVFNETLDEHVSAGIEQFAAEARTALGESLGFLAHELRNALSSASMAFALLQRGEVPIRGLTADMVKRNLQRMDRLIDDALTAARIEGGQRPALHDVALDPLLADVAASAVPERGVRLTVAGVTGAVARGDERLLVSAVSNLVQNGIKFSRDGAGVTVRVLVDDTNATIEVEDSCGGLPPGVEELFQPFVQRTGDRRGAGLGLAIVRDAVRVLAGDVLVREVPGKGCVFAIRLPRAR